MSGWRDEADEPIRPLSEDDPAPGLEGLPRLDLEPVETAVPALVDQAIQGPVVLTRHGRESFVLLPLDIWRRVWGAVPRPPVIDVDPADRPRRGRKPRGPA
ncbi:hypothetical protein GCM10011504_05030 [Siccirubricoccus deserti]|uniref:Uncharacterized protein n=1 Tax=Siccirubricoccus deserti TaxID=2013562 RepID=A0A9X0UBX9_9PROT|nr:type II toxin-antitoxin system Phd/YefM family antitoxin [Siccirubricoccus deserti]MBC4013826.1 hypothetical protein [Siccirubricoccus deserti]GGC29809.1 hypothetical protein GCM10011504_05030 [Siccirubricoccus deserti]